MQKMYEGKAFSPPTSLTRDIGAADTIVYVEDESVFPAPPGYATIGTDESGETIEYAAVAPGVLSGCVRGVEGTAQNWLTGESISRCWNNADYEALRGNITELEEKKLDRTGEGREVTVAFDEAEAGEPIRSGESLGTLFGKMKQWLGALGSAAWKDTGTSPGTVAEGDHVHQSYDGHLEDRDIHVSIDEKEGWNSKSATVAVGGTKPTDPNTVVWYNTSAAAQTYVPMTCVANPVRGNLLMTDSTGQAQDSGVPCELVRGYSNANLLDNWYLENPINQRGQSDYHRVSYTIDRWRLFALANDVAGIRLIDGATELYNTSGQCRLRQIIENPLLYSKKIVTFSVKANSDCQIVQLIIGGHEGPLADHNMTLYAHEEYHNVKAGDILTTTGTLPENNGYLCVQISLLNNNTTFRPAAVKLELGHRSTLHLDPPPNYGQELAKCQRYLYLSSNGTSNFIRAGRISTNVIYFDLSVPVTMRANPTIVSSSAMEVLSVGASGAAQKGFSYSTSLTNGALRINANKTAHSLTDATINIVQALFSAEL